MNNNNILLNKKRIWDRRIPTFLALGILLVGIVVTISFVKEGTITIGQATADITPENIKITNVSDTSFSVMFTTKEKSVGAVKIENGESSSSLEIDDRLKTTAEQKALYSHHITINNLKPQTTYNFSILSENKIFDKSGQKYTTTTGPTIKSISSNSDVISGKVYLPTGENASDVLVVASSPLTQDISTYTNEGGEFVLPVNLLRDTTFSNYVALAPYATLSLSMLYKSSSTNVAILYKNSQNIPPITLSENYDFSSDTDTDEEVASPGGQLTVPPPSVKKGEVTIQTPQDSQNFIDTKPLFQGTAPPDAKVKITIHSDDSIVAEVSANKSGTWTFRPPTNLSPGNHTITIETIDVSGIIKRITQSFTVFAQGSQVTQSATPSATPTVTKQPTPTLTPTRTPTPTLRITATPAPSPKATSTPTPTVFASPTITVTATPVLLSSAVATTTPTLQQPGSPMSTIALGAISLLFIIAGAAIFFAL